MLMRRGLKDLSLKPHKLLSLLKLAYNLNKLT